ncbi:GNAT family N-acetyltransferase [Aeromonas media]|uniref:GNAT family N-acetyltransferase n=1 Tax=Aeromonas media TaxID=651 RepID=UPI0002787B46|nr:GNAT family N-acetyltransferase [Aeromonas media]AHX59987.1 putative acetyltransferase [Aeromonas media WS]MBP8051711.1 N-acetyltransferase [Aeromonas sp.]QQQ12656.1 N-acetyltransferase [Aeromonas media]
MPTPIVRLLPMDEAAFPAYRDYFIDDYAQDLASNHGLILADARQQAEASLLQHLPQGAATPGQSLLCILPVSDNVGGADAPTTAIAGYLWHSIDSAAHTTFIYDFYIFPTHRGLGYGKAAMAVLEAELKCLGVSQIKLRVAHDNPRARALYEEIGFRITGYNMAKTLG